MITRKSFLVLSLSFILCGLNTIFAQQSNVAIVLNEYSTTNIGTPVDNYGVQSDWVEIYNAHTSSVSLAGYYLSNDRNNMFKWKFPSGLVMGPGQFIGIWLSGKNTTSGGSYHANFTLDQCKNQWLILSTSQGVVRDSVFVQKTMAGHTRGRVDIAQKGVGAWKLYTSHSYLQPNPTVNNYVDYAPTPVAISEPAASPTSTFANTAGGFYPGNTAIMYFKLKGFTYDTAFGQCFDIFYTTDGSFPVPGYPPVGSTLRYNDSTNGTTQLTFASTKILRALTVPNPTRSCVSDYLPSFCETNTYFIDNEHNSFSSDFGIVSLAMDTSWFSSSGAFSPTIHAEYYDSKKQMSEGYASITRPPQEEWKTQQKGFYITIDDRFGFGCGFEGKVFNVEGLGASARTSFPTLHLKAGDIESHSAPSFSPTSSFSEGTGIRDVFYQSLAAKYNLNVNPLHVKPVITFINGRYWGVYDLREVYDKHYENYYNNQSKDSLDLNFYHNSDGALTYSDGSHSTFNNDFKAEVYNKITAGPLTSTNVYNKIMTKLDKESFIDYMILNNYAMNNDTWSYNIAYGKGGQSFKSGNKWHYYLWNMPTIFNYSAVSNTYVNNNCNMSLCDYTQNYQVSPLTGNGHGIMLKYLMNTSSGVNAASNGAFQLQYKNRYQDLLNGPLQCKTILKHYDYVRELYFKEMKYHEDPSSAPYPGQFKTAIDLWDSNTVRLRRAIECRCFAAANSFSKPGCYGATGPFPITVDVFPAGAGTVKLNSFAIDSYQWSGNYFATTLSFKAVPSNTTFVFDHWETKHTPLNSRPLSLDSIAISFFKADDIVAVFTDKSSDLVATGENANVPTAFSPNGDGINDVFKPLGSAKFTSEYEMTIWSRWGEQVFRSVSPDDGWDGNYKGVQSITGVYAFVISYKNIYGESKLLKGNVTLTR